ncbi:MAG: PD40 domain-containing protein [Chloroflexi bacterium]|nr:PD40 domain-containing protein [Chloroflexota bacterium]
MSGRSAFILVAGALGCLVTVFCIGVLAFTFLTLYNTQIASLEPINRIAFLDNDNNIHVVDSRGERAVVLTSDANDRRIYTFPTFSPNSQRVAFMGISGTPAQREGSLYTVPISGGTPKVVYSSASQFPFYLYWAPDNQRVGFLAQSENELSLLLGDADGKEIARKVETGSPMYWSWAPDSRALLLHIGGSRRDSPRARLALVPGENNVEPKNLAQSPAAFLAPQYSPDGSAILYAASDSSESDGLFVADAQGAGARLIANYRGRIAFEWSPDGKKIAWMTTPPTTRLPNLGKIESSARDGSEKISLIDEDALAFFWSPDSARIIYLTLVRPGGTQGCAPECARGVGLAAPRAQDALRLRWQIVTLADKQIKTVVSFQPTTEFLSVLPYFDQYARSLTFWSPNSDEIVYTQSEGEDKGSVWVIGVNGDAKPRRIADGLFAVWSWK